MKRSAGLLPNMSSEVEPSMGLCATLQATLQVINISWAYLLHVCRGARQGRVLGSTAQGAPHAARTQQLRGQAVLCQHGSHAAGQLCQGEALLPERSLQLGAERLC